MFWHGTTIRQRDEKFELRGANGRLPPLPGLGAVAVDDCVIGPAIDSAVWSSLLSAGSAEDALKLKTVRDLLANTDWTGVALPVAHAASRAR